MDKNIDQLSDNEKIVLYKYIHDLHITLLCSIIILSIPIIFFILDGIYCFLNFKMTDGYLSILLVIVYTLSIATKIGKRYLLNWWKKAKCLKLGNFTVNREVIKNRTTEYDNVSKDDSYLWRLLMRTSFYSCHVSTENYENVDVYGVEVLGNYGDRWVNMQIGKVACILYIADIKKPICIADGNNNLA